MRLGGGRGRKEIEKREEEEEENHDDYSITSAGTNFTEEPC